MKLQRRAITSVLWIASGRSANSSIISAGRLQRCSGVSRRRCSWPTWAPSAMLSSTSWASNPSALHEMHVVGRDQRHVVAQRELDQRRLARVLGGKTMAHQLDVEAAGEQRHQALEHRLGEAAVAVQQGLAERPLGAAGERDQALRARRPDHPARAPRRRRPRRRDRRGSKASAGSGSRPGSGPAPAARPAPAAGRWRRPAHAPRAAEGSRPAAAPRPWRRTGSPATHRTDWRGRRCRPPASRPGGSARAAPRGGPCSPATRSRNGPADGRRLRGSTAAPWLGGGCKLGQLGRALNLLATSSRSC